MDMNINCFRPLSCQGLASQMAEREPSSCATGSQVSKLYQMSGFGCNMRRFSGRGAGQVDEDKRRQNRKDLSLGDQTGNIEASFSKVS